MYSELAGKTVVVTGGSRGIGAETGRAFAALGADVCLVGRDSEALDHAVSAATVPGPSRK